MNAASASQAESILAATPAPSSSVMAPPAGYTASQLIFEDQFTGATLNANNWNPWMGQNGNRWGDLGRLPSPYSAGSNNAATTISYDNCYPAGTAVDNGAGIHLLTGASGLQAIASPDMTYSSLGYTWAGAQISSYGHMYLPATGGFLQIRAKMPDQRWGGWGALWLLPNGGTDGSEFDIIDGGVNVAGNGNSASNSTMFSKWFGTGEGSFYSAGVDLTADFHTYGVEYKPGYWFKVYLDGKLIHTWTNGVSSNAAYEIIITNQIANPSDSGWHSVPDANHQVPFTLTVDDVQIYKLP